jgi:hypothetical protein
MLEAVRSLDRAPEREVAREKDVRPIERHEQEPARRPRPDTRDLGQGRLDLVVRHPRERLVAQAPFDEPFCERTQDLTPVRTPIGDAWFLSSDEPAFREHAGPAAAARLLPSGDTYYLLQGADRELLVPDAAQRAALWTSRVWPGAVLVGGEIVGTWRRASADVTVQSWRRLTGAERAAVEAEAASLPLPGLARQIAVRWDELFGV